MDLVDRLSDIAHRAKNQGVTGDCNAGMGVLV